LNRKALGARRSRAFVNGCEHFHLMQLAGVLRVMCRCVTRRTVLRVLSSQQGGRLEAGGERSVVFNLSPTGRGGPWCSTVAQLVNTSPRGTLRLKRGSRGPRFHRGTRPSSLRKAVHRTKATRNSEQPRTSSSTGCLADFRRQSVVHCRTWRAPLRRPDLQVTRLL
jgi:hypothetical protein